MKSNFMNIDYWIDFARFLQNEWKKAEEENIKMRMEAIYACQVFVQEMIYFLDFQKYDYPFNPRRKK